MKCKSLQVIITRFGIVKERRLHENFYTKDTFNKLGYKAEINNYTASRIN